MRHHFTWVDIPVLDLDRASTFFSQILNLSVKQEVPYIPVSVFNHSEGMVSGCLFRKEGFLPSEHGPLIYLNVDGRLDQAIALVEKLGGRILEPKKSIPPYGYRAVILDSEGNRLALHSK
jgi:predicted enzyme related to lactoylglutathione lyase